MIGGAKMSLPCPTCGATGNEPCTTFDVISPGVLSERYACETHVLRTVRESYWRAVSIRLALAKGGKHDRDALDVH